MNREPTETDRSGPEPSDGPGELHAEAHDRVRRSGQRYTPNRRALVELLARAERPLTIPEILRRRRQLAQSSVYRNLSLLEQAGVVARIVTSDDHARYELAEDLTDHHHHLICTRCGRVDDFTVTESVEDALERTIASVETTTGFRPERHRLDLLGTCTDCLS